MKKVCKNCKRVFETMSCKQNYCTVSCRNNYHYYRHQQARVEYQRKFRRTGEYAVDKVQCLICGKWYHHPMSHCWQTHKVLSKEYKIMFGFDITKSQLSKKVQDVMSENTLARFDSIEANLLRHRDKTCFKKGHQVRYTRSAETAERLRHQFDDYHKAVKEGRIKWHYNTK